MNKILYYPYINIPRTDWVLRTLLYYENIGSIVPQEYFYDPERYYEPFMLELVRSELVLPVDPLKVLDHPWETTKPFIQFIEKNRRNVGRSRRNFPIERENGTFHAGKFQDAKIHADKLDGEIFYHLEQLGLAKRSEDRWYLVEQKTADQLMKFLATVIGAKLEMLPTTDHIKPEDLRKPTVIKQRKRETILRSLIPFPEDLDLIRVQRFKEKHNDLLIAFKNRVELIALDPNIKEGTALFNENLRELQIRKDELSAKMNESKFNNILFGTICGIIGASYGLTVTETTGALLGVLPGFAHTIYSALKVEKAENVFDQSGLKYLALVDKQLRKGNQNSRLG